MAQVKPECGAQLAATLAAAGVLVRSRQVIAGLKHGCTPEQLEQLAELLRAVVPPKQGGGAGRTGAAKKLD